MIKAIAATILAYVCYILFYATAITLIYYLLGIANRFHEGLGSHHVFNRLLMSSVANFIGAFVSFVIVGYFIRAVRLQVVFNIFAIILVIVFAASFIAQISTFLKSDGARGAGLIYPIIQFICSLIGASFGKLLIADGAE